MTRTTTLWSLLLLSAALALGSCAKDATEQATGPEPEAKAASKLVFSSENAVKGELLVCFGEEAVAGIESSVMQVTRSGGVATRSGIADFDAVLGNIGVKALQRLFPVDERNEERTRAAGLHRWYVVEFDDSADLDKAALDMARIAEVSKVEFNQQLMHVHDGKVIPLAETGAAPQTRAAVGFNDPHLGKQWHYINTGDKSIYSKIKAGADVNCDEAWQLCTGDPRVIVAVVDNCVQWDHPDLAANMWTNTAEQNGSEGRDDDSNGYADDIHGFNFVDNTTLTISTKGDAPDHGTHVAGTVAAVNNNGTGVAGIAGGSGKNDGVKIMSCQIFHDDDGGSAAISAKAIKYAADNGAVICQNSWGYAAGALSYDQWSSADRATKEAIDYFIRYAGMSPDGETQTGPMAGGVVIFAAGNENSGQPGYPAAYEPCISVAAVSCTYEAAWYTNYGPTVDICAPGGGDAADFSRPIHYNEGYNLSTLPTDLQNGMTFVYTNFRGEVETHTIDYVSETLGYGYMQGTSMACPHVSGVAALIVSQFGAPGFTNKQLKEKLFSTARDIDSYQGPIYNGRGTYAGKIGKLVDAGAALDSGEVPPVSDQPTITPATGQNDTFTLGASERKTLQYTLAGYMEWRLDDPSGKIAKSIDGDVVTLTIDASQYAAGSYTAELLAMNGTKTAKRTIAYTVSKGDNPTGISMDFYPNPCTDVLNILPNYSGESTIRIRNSMGTEVMNITLGLINEEPVKLDVSGLASGTYLVQVTYNGIQITRTIVKR